MEKQLLELRPTRYLCPYCGEWHELNLEFELGRYGSEHEPARVECEEIWNRNLYDFSFKGDYCYYIIQAPDCIFNRKQMLEGKIAISSITECTDKPIVTFHVEHTIKEKHTLCDRDICEYSHCCDSNRHIKITLGFEFEQSDYNRIIQRAQKEKEQLIEKQDVQKTREKNKIKEKHSMKNNIFNMNLEFGINNDENIASTLMGIAVKHEGSWRIYDKNKKEITDVGNMQLGNLPIFIRPTIEISEGDLIKDAGEYYFVTDVQEGKTQTLHARTGEMKTVAPIKNVLGISSYSKVIALSDSLNLSKNFDVGELAIMSTMFNQTGENGGQMNQILPLMLFKDKLGKDDDTMKLLLMSSMTSTEGDGGQMNQILPLMFFKDKLGENDDMMKMLLMSSMMGGNTENSNNPLMSYLMFDTLMDKKDDKNLQKQNDESLQQTNPEVIQLEDKEHEINE